MQIVYIAGYGRSGSTILDMLLASHPHVMGAGELARLFDQWLANHTCSCQKPIRECEFWQPIFDTFMQSMPNISIEECAQITLQVESLQNAWRFYLRRFSMVERTYGHIWRTMLPLIIQQTGGQWIVDSSKSTRATNGRSAALRYLCGYDVQVVHLVRDPRAVTWSVLRGSNRKLEAGDDATLRGGALRAVLSWLMTNMAVQFLPHNWGQQRVRYEDMITETQATLQGVYNALGLDAEGTNITMPLSCGHGVAGNRLRRRQIDVLKLDEEWRTHLPRSARIVVWLSWPLAQSYRYSFK